MKFQYNDGGRRAAGFKGDAGDCVCRAVAIAADLPYSTVYAALAKSTGAQRATTRSGKRPASARNGINTKRQWFKDYMAALGFEWTPTMYVAAANALDGGQGRDVSSLADALA